MDSIKIKVLVKPGKSKTRVIDLLEDGTIKIEIGAAAERNRANMELIKFLKKNLGGTAKIVSGHRSRRKLVVIKNPTVSNWKEKLLTEK